MKRVILVLLFLAGITTCAHTKEGRLLRFPDVHLDKVAFVYAGDIYTAPRSGGQAVRLTSHEGLELFPKFSPDGSIIAFTGQYDGDWAVYVMPVGGGQPKRLTWHPGIQQSSERFGPENLVMGWNAEGTHVLYRSRKGATDVWDGRTYLVSLEGGLPEPLPMKQAGFTSLSPDGQWVAYCPIFRDFRTWKRYKGGMAQDVWVFDMQALTSEKITDWEGSDNMPMWYLDKIYFNSDRTRPSGRLNLHRYDTKSKETVPVTDFVEYDVRWPSLGPDGIAFEMGGFVYVMDLPSERIHKVEIDLITDRHTVRPEIRDVDDDISEYEVAPNGKRVVFAARGDLFTVPVKEGNTRKLVTRSNSRERSPAWSPDGEWIAYYTDATGEERLMVTAHDASETQALTAEAKGRRGDPTWSPDSKKLAFFDIGGAIRCLDIETEELILIDSAEYGGLGGPAWSPDSRYLAFVKSFENRIRGIFIYDFEDGSVKPVTEGYTNDYWPTFSPDGKYLFFVSQRNFNPILSDYEFSFVNQAIENLYLIVLQDGVPSPFLPGSDEAVDAESEEADESDGETGDDKNIAVEIDFDGIFERQVALDLPSGNYSYPAAIDGALFYLSNPIFGLRGKAVQEERVLHKYDLEKEEDHQFLEKAGSYRVTPDGKHILLSEGGSYYVVSTGGKSADLSEGRISTSGLETTVDYRAEFEQMFYEVWRNERDYFYDANLHGVDWEEVRDKYAVMLPYVAHRFDLVYLIGEMIGELACSHTYVGGGEWPKVKSADVGVFGCDFEIDAENDRIRISRILQGENFDESLRSPLIEPGVDVQPGDYLLSIDGQKVTAATNPYSLTENTVGRTVTLLVNDRPTENGAREVEIKPLSSESGLRYYDWVANNRAYVDSVSGGDIGYLHIPDMSSYGLYRFTKMFYHQMRKPGLIIDVRWNGGGFVSGLILERLRRVVGAMGKGRYGNNWRSPASAVHAHMLTLTNEFSCSDGDYFPYFFRQYGLGPLMGKRTWGGVIGINGFTRLVDGGYYTVPGYGIYSLEGEWVMENVGVAPDIEVENRPERLVQGYDDQLDQAIENILTRLEEDPKTLPEVNGPPDER